MRGLLCFCRPAATADVVDFAMVEFFSSAGSDNYFDKACPWIWEGGASEGTLITGAFGLNMDRGFLEVFTVSFSDLLKLLKNHPPTDRILSSL